MCLVFGVGAAGADWIGRLAQAEWFTGLEPWAEDLAASGGISAGSWTMPSTSAEDWHHLKAEIETFVAQPSLPNAILATVAIPSDAGPRDLAAAIGLVSALRKRRDSRGCRMAVVATVEAGLSATPNLVYALQDQGAFVVQAGLGASGDFVHHFPLRAVVLTGRLICCELADFLTCWKPGSAAELHVIPLSVDEAEPVLLQLPVASALEGRICGFNAIAHLDPNTSGPDDLIEFDRLATICRQTVIDSDGDLVIFTNGVRLDGVTGTADLLLIHEA